MEEKLAAYRARKAKEKAAEHSLVNRLKTSIFSARKPDFKSTDGKNKDANQPDEDVAAQCLEQNIDDMSTVCNDPNQSRAMYWGLAILKLLLWLCIWGIFIEIQFGAVFFTISLITFIYFNTRSGKTDDKPSAYSVFNKNCERIQGTLTAEQMQREMFRVPGLPS